MVITTQPKDGLDSNIDTTPLNWGSLLYPHHPFTLLNPPRTNPAINAIVGIIIKIILGVAWTALSFFCGAYVGHRFNLSRDKRKEFNDAADGVRRKLMKQLAAFKASKPPCVIINNDEIFIICDMLPKNKARKLSINYEKYLAEITPERLEYESDPVTEQWSIGDTGQATEVTEKLLSMLKRK